jgi:hypothetical protein
MKWFKHYTKSMTDAKIEKLIMKYGIEGYGIYFACLEIIAGNLTIENITFELEHDVEILAYKFKIDTVKLMEIMKYCVNLGLFEYNESNQRISCMKLLKYIDDSTAKNPEIRKIVSHCKGNSELFGIIPKESEQIRLDKIRLDKNRIDNINILSSDKSDNSPPVFENPIKPKKQEKKETLYNTHTWNDLVRIYDKLHKGSGGGLINWKQEVRAYKEIIDMLSLVATETMPLITALYQVYDWVCDNKFVKQTNIDLTPNRLIKFISDVTKEHRFEDHYDLIKKDKYNDYYNYCVCFMSDAERKRFDIGEDIKK